MEMKYVDLIDLYLDNEDLRDFKVIVSDKHYNFSKKATWGNIAGCRYDLYERKVELCTMSAVRAYSTPTRLFFNRRKKYKQLVTLSELCTRLLKIIPRTREDCGLIPLCYLTNSWRYLIHDFQIDRQNKCVVCVIHT